MIFKVLAYQIGLFIPFLLTCAICPSYADFKDDDGFDPGTRGRLWSYFVTTGFTKKRADSCSLVDNKATVREYYTVNFWGEICEPDERCDWWKAKNVDCQKWCTAKAAENAQSSNEDQSNTDFVFASCNLKMDSCECGLIVDSDGGDSPKSPGVVYAKEGWMSRTFVDECFDRFKLIEYFTPHEQVKTGTIEFVELEEGLRIPFRNHDCRSVCPNDNVGTCQVKRITPIHGEKNAAYCNCKPLPLEKSYFDSDHGFKPDVPGYVQGKFTASCDGEATGEYHYDSCALGDLVEVTVEPEDPNDKSCGLQHSDKFVDCRKFCFFERGGKTGGCELTEMQIEPLKDIGIKHPKVGYCHCEKPRDESTLLYGDYPAEEEYPGPTPEETPVEEALPESTPWESIHDEELS